MKNFKLKYNTTSTRDEIHQKTEKYVFFMQKTPEV